MKLILDHALKWHSFDDMNIFQQFNNKNQEEAILLLFSILEQKYGHQIVSYSLGYLTISTNGLSDTEMDDLLSCNDIVLNDVYDYHDPPLPGAIRIPPLLWSRIKYEISEYLVQKVLINKKVVSDWYHRKFREVAYNKYCLLLDRVAELNKHLADIYLHENGMNRTIILSKRNGLVIKDANRMITQQPLNEKNKRKLDVLSHYLTNSRNYFLLNEHCFSNIKYLLAKIKAFDLNKLLNDFSEYFKIHQLNAPEGTNDEYNHEQIEIVYKFLIFNEKPIRADPLIIISLLIGQLDFHCYSEVKRKNFTHLESLVRQPHEYCELNQGYFLKPLYPSIPSFNSPIKWFLDGFNKILCTSKSKTKIIALKISNLDEITSNNRLTNNNNINFGNYKELVIVNLIDLKVNYLELNPNFNLMKCYLLDNSDNILYILYETHLSLYDVEKSVYLFDTNIRWRTQDGHIYKSFYFMIRKHVNHVTIWNEVEKPETREIKKVNAADSKKEIQKYLTDPNVTWEIRVGKFSRKDSQRSNII